MTNLPPHHHIVQQLRDLLTQDQAFPVPHELLVWLDQRIAGFEVDIHKIVASRQQIAVIWSLSDVQEVRPDLTQNQCWEVLRSQAEVLFGAAP